MLPFPLAVGSLRTSRSVICPFPHLLCKLSVGAGHGLNYVNVHRVAEIQKIEEFNIGHSIVARASLVGMERAVREMVALLQ